MRCEIVHDARGLEGLAPEWDALAGEAQVGLFLSHRWLAAWWRAFHGVDELWVLTLRDGERLMAAWPLCLRAPRSGPLKASELRVLGDLGGAQRSLLVRPRDLDVAAQAFVDALAAERGWDVLEAPIASRAVGEALERAASARGGRVDRGESPPRAYADLPALEGLEAFVGARRPPRVGDGVTWVASPDPTRGLEELVVLLRKEWAARESVSPAADPHALQFLGEIVPQLAALGQARVGVVAVAGRAVAADLVVVDGERHVQLLRGADPERPAAAVEVSLGSIEAAVRAGARRFEFAPSDVDSPLRTAQGHHLRVRMWNSTAAGRLRRGVETIKVAADAMGWPRRDAPARPPLALRAFDGLRGRLRSATPELVQRAMARLASYSTLHLYRGELFARGLRDTGDVGIRLFERTAFESLSEAARDEFCARLDLQLSYCRQKWDRGDLVVLAEVAGRPAGIVWCARVAVYVPDIGREVRPGVGECYIHDVYVHPDERGRQVAPAMLDFLARELRARDVYRAWALIERTNTASTRAFEKAAYASVADVVYARMGLASRLLVRPPDPEARAFLGL